MTSEYVVGNLTRVISVLFSHIKDSVNCCLEISEKPGKNDSSFATSHRKVIEMLVNICRVSTTPGNPGHLLELIWSSCKFWCKMSKIDCIDFQS